MLKRFSSLAAEAIIMAIVVAGVLKFFLTVVGTGAESYRAIFWPTLGVILILNFASAIFIGSWCEKFDQEYRKGKNYRAAFESACGRTRIHAPRWILRSVRKKRY
jgi:hypothetical protein